MIDIFDKRISHFKLLNLQTHSCEKQQVFYGSKQSLSNLSVESLFHFHILKGALLLQRGKEISLL